MITMFQQPSQGDRVNVSELVGSLVLIWVHEVRDGIMTPFGEKEAAACDVHVLDGPKSGEKFGNTLIFQGALIGSLRAAAGGDPVLARIGQGVAKPGQSAPFVLQPFSDADAAIATTYISGMAKPFQAAASSNGQTANPTAAASPAAASSSPAAASPASVDISKLPPEVQELIRQTQGAAS